MRERFTENAEKVLKLAKKAAKNNGNGYIGSEHLLLGLLEEGEGTAAILLKESGADTVKIRTLVANLITSEGDTLTEETDYTPRTEIILENAVHEADFFHMEKVGTEHLLLGLIKEGTGVAAAVLAEHDEIETLIFDEIDTGISGKAANSVAMKLKAIAKKHQVMCISHLPNIAASADYNYFISKKVQEERTKTDVKLLDEEEVIKEIARISSGEVNDITLKYAYDLRNKKAS